MKNCPLKKELLDTTTVAQIHVRLKEVHPSVEMGKNTALFSF